ncbi:MAG: hypothetical protein U1F43_06675 [Myxococcota bacterium]
MILIACVVVAAFSAPPPAPAPAPPALPPITDALPFTKLLAGDMANLPDDQLLTVAEHMRSRLFLDEATTVIEVASDLELALRFATAVQLLEARPSVANGPQAPALRAAARSAAFLLHSTGFAYETREDVRASVEAILPAQNAPNRAAVEAMITSVRAMRAYGNAWFPLALSAVEKDQPDAPGSLVQEGWWLAHEGKSLEAAQVFTKSLSVAPVGDVALAAYEALLTANQPESDAVAAELRTRIVKSVPVLGGQFASRLDYIEDTRATAAFEAKAGTADRDTSIAQVFRYLRVGRPGAAELLVRDVLGRWPADAQSWHAAAEAYYLLGRYESLRVLFLDAESGGHFDARLREVRIAARMMLRVHESLGEMHHPLADGDLDGDLDAYVAASGGKGSTAELAAHVARMFIAIADWMGKKNGPAAGPAFDAASKRIEALVLARPKDPEALRAALVAWAGIEKATVGVQRVSALAAKLPADQALGVSFLLARVEAGVALRERDPVGMKSALARFAAIDKILSKKPGSAAAGTIDRAAYTLAATTARLAAKVLTGEPVSEPDLGLARGALAGIDGAFDLSSDDGRALAQGRALTAGTLALLARDVSAPDQFRLARAAKRDELGLLAGGIVQVLAGDALGAGELYERASVEATRPAIQQWLAFASYQAAAQTGDTASAKRALTAAVDQWDAAKLPAVAQPGSVRPLFVGDFNIGLRVSPGEPLALDIRASPVLTLIPEIVTSKAEAQAALVGMK